MGCRGLSCVVGEVLVQTDREKKGREEKRHLEMTEERDTASMRLLDVLLRGVMHRYR